MKIEPFKVTLSVESDDISTLVYLSNIITCEEFRMLTMGLKADGNRTLHISDTDDGVLVRAGGVIGIRHLDHAQQSSIEERRSFIGGEKEFLKLILIEAVNGFNDLARDFKS